MSPSEKRPSESGRGPRHSGEPVPGDGECCPEHGVFCDEAWAAIAKRLGLPSRQGQVARGLVAGQSDDEIARSLGLSWETVQTHMKRLHARLNIQNRVELVNLAWAAYYAWRRESPPPKVCPENSGLASF